MKLNVFIYVTLLFVFIFFAQCSRAENIRFNSDIYILENVTFSDINKGFENEYFPENHKLKNPDKMLGIYYYPEVKNSIKFAENADKEIETKASVVLLKFIENKKQNKAVLSFIDVGEADGKPYIEHNIYKYEPHPSKGTMILKYSARYFTKSDSEIISVSKDIKTSNDDLIEQIIISAIPPIAESKI